MRFHFEATGIGSVPFTDPEKACDLILDNFDTVPFWPQLPRRSFLENMYVQYSQGLPGIAVDCDKKTIHIDSTRVASEIEETYGRYVDGDSDFFRISEDYAPGLYAFLDRVKKSPPDRAKFIKGQITGPVSYGLFLTDENKKSVIYDKDLFEVLSKVLVMKARWQISKLRKVFSSIIVFIDEPYLTSIGSSFVNIDPGLAAAKLDELASAIKKDGALAAVHCCGNTDWSALLKRDIDILSFDSYNFIKEFSLYSSDIKNFLKKGGTIAFGAVPSSEEIDGQTRKTLAERFESALGILKDKGMEQENISAMITPACGVGSLDENRAERVLEATRALSERLRKTVR